MLCPFCNKEISEGAAFCRLCGNHLSGGFAQNEGQASTPLEETRRTYVNSVDPFSQPNMPPSTTPNMPPFTQSPTPSSAQSPMSPFTQSPMPYSANAANATPSANKPKSNKLRVALIAALSVVVLGGGFAAAWFSGALDSIFPRDKKPDTSQQSSADERQLDNEDNKNVDDNGNGNNNGNDDNIVDNGGGNSGGSGGGKRISGKNASITALLNELQIDTYTSNDPTARGALEESVINFTNLALGSVSNASSTETTNGLGTAGIEFNLTSNIADDYLDEIGALVSASIDAGMTAQVKEILRILGVSEFKIGIEGSGELIGTTLNPIVAINTDWSIKSKRFLSANAYMDTNEMVFSVPDLSTKLFSLPSNQLAPVDATEMEELGYQLEQIQKLGYYIDELMPSLNEIIVSFINEIDDISDGSESISISGKDFTLDTLDIKLTEESVTRAAVAAITALKNDPNAVRLIVEANNEVLTELFSTPIIDAQLITSSLDEGLKFLNDSLSDNAFGEETMYLRLYVYNDSLVGYASQLELNGSDGQCGFLIIPNEVYSFWFNDMSNIDAGVPTAKDGVTVYKYPGYGDRYEVYGELNDNAAGTSGDLRFFMRDDYYNEEFDAKLLSFSDLNMKAVFGIPFVTGAFTMSMADLNNAFSGKTSSQIDFVREMAYAMDSVNQLPFIKDLAVTIELKATDSDYTTSLILEAPTRQSSISLSARFYALDKTISPPVGERLAMDSIDSETQMQLGLEVLSAMTAKIDELSLMGYDVSWLKDLLASSLMSAGSGSGTAAIPDYGTGTGVYDYGTEPDEYSASTTPDTTGSSASASASASGFGGIGGADLTGKYNVVSFISDGQDYLSLLSGLGMDLDLYIELQYDVTGVGKFNMVLSTLGIENVEGTFTVNGKDLTLTANGEDIKGTLDGNKITLEEDGNLLVFEKN